MQIREGRPPRSGQLKRVGVELGRAARVRLTWMDYYRATENAALTCRHFGISRQTFYRWQRRYDPLDLTTLEEVPGRPTNRELLIRGHKRVSRYRSALLSGQLPVRP